MLARTRMAGGGGQMGRSGRRGRRSRATAPATSSPTTIASTRAGTGSNVPAAAAPPGPGVADWFGAGVMGGPADGLGEAVAAGEAVAMEEAVAVTVAVAAAVAVGFAVGFAVGDAVGRAVGLTVGFGVAVGVDPALTTIVPVICSGWIWQK